MVVPIFQVHFQARYGQIDSRIVDQNVNTAELLFDPGNASPDLLQVADIHFELKTCRSFRTERRGFRQTDSGFVGDCYVRTRMRERHGYGLP
jgi:hypothetical protein